MVLIHKVKEGYCGIGIVEVLWKLVVGIIIFWHTASISYPGLLYTFRAGCGIGTASVEVKLLQKLVAIREDVL